MALKTDITSPDQRGPLTVFTRAGCAACGATIRLLNAYQVAVDQIVDVDADPEARAYLMALGHSALPVVVAGSRRWSGYRDDEIRALVKGVAA